jgi:sulfoxide reductase catalytic subunit YedY
MPKGSEITPEKVFLNRRQFMAGATALAAGASLPSTGQAQSIDDYEALNVAIKDSPYSTKDPANPFEDITTYNNFYEFGTGKGDPAANAGALTTKPWSIKVGGLVNNPSTIDMNDILNSPELEERIYRLRCVEAWSMVIPWVGIPLANVLKKYDYQGGAKYVAFETLVRPEEMIGQRSAFGLDWPYVEGLRLDEAMHPLTILAVGVYGKEMPNQNGAPIRLVVPWKYGFKSIKSIVGINFVAQQPPTTWNLQAPSEYGFYSNVNPGVDHPRWSQKSEKIIGSGIFGSRRQTEQFNGYKEEVASLYEGMDLVKNY